MSERRGSAAHYSCMQKILEYYGSPAPMTAAMLYGAALQRLPTEPQALSVAIQSQLLHEHVGPSYGVEISSDRKQGSQLRSVDEMLDAIFERDDQPLTAARPLEHRLIGVCRHFVVLMAATLRAQGVPARARCGFGTYFDRKMAVDHWICEYWDRDEQRWVRVDPQLDEHQRRLFKIDFSPLDVPHDRFLVAGVAWRKCRTGAADPKKFGIMDMSGLWFIAGNVLRDFAALNKMEMLPWDMWGAMPAIGSTLSAQQLSLVDALAQLTLEPDATFDLLRNRYEAEPALRVSDKVFNAITQRLESVAAYSSH